MSHEWSELQIAVAAAHLLLIGASTAVLAARFLPHLGPFLQYGKVLSASSPAPTATSPPWLEFLYSLTVPKRWFVHFYLLSLALCGLILAYANVSLPLVLMTAHSARRVAESLWVDKLSAHARIHVSHYIVGMCFYVCMAVAMIQPSHKLPLLLVLASVALFVASSGYHHWCHQYLASLKKYTLPSLGLFRLVACPHYLAEMGIYASLVMANPSSSLLWTAFAWVVINLAVSAEQTQRYYVSQFGLKGGVPSHAVIPYIF